MRLSRVRNIVIHCAATPNGSESWIIDDIDDWHKDKGFRRSTTAAAEHSPRLLHVGYHAVIHVDGSVHWGRALNERGAHAYGHNSDSWGVCLIGTDAFTVDQWVSLKKLVTQWRSQADIKRVIGHNETEHSKKIGKKCPGFDVQEWLADDMEPPADHTLVI